MRASSQHLYDLEKNNMKSQVRLAGDILGIGAEIVQDAVDFAGFRDKYLAHSGSYPSRTELNSWFGQDKKAQTLAGTFLNAYLDYRSVN